MSRPPREPPHPAPDLNSAQYWDERFRENWDERGGRLQSRSFMQLLVASLPVQVAAEIRSQRLSILDCGCAKGDGTAVLARHFDTSQVQGFDHSTVAIEEARRSFPDLEFFASSFRQLASGSDVLISSHCFEHLEDPLAGLAHLLGCARRYFVLLVPFRESFPIDPEHRWIIHAETFPESLAKWRQSHRVVLPPIPVWAQTQLLLIYEPARRLARPKLPRASELECQAQLLTIAHTLRRQEGEANEAGPPDGSQRLEP